jgi:2-dehydro-3-deoxygluconokinase
MRICCAGEVMVELAGEARAGIYRQGLGGDTFNTAVYMARAGLEVDYITRLGDDRFSESILALLQCEGIGTANIARIAGRQPGLYLIDNDTNGERHFRYWREHSPARELFDRPLNVGDCQVFYFTGITLAVTRSGAAGLQALLAQLREQNTRVVFDPNYRPHLWDTKSQAQEHYRQVLPYCDTVLPTLDDESALWDIATAADCARMYRDFGATEIVIKTPDLSAHVFSDGQQVQRQAQAVAAVDTTGAGDSFNAAYLAARLRGASFALALAAAQQLAADVVQHRGALLPRPASRTSQTSQTSQTEGQ